MGSREFEIIELGGKESKLKLIELQTLALSQCDAKPQSLSLNLNIGFSMGKTFPNENVLIFIGKFTGNFNGSLKNFGINNLMFQDNINYEWRKSDKIIMLQFLFEIIYLGSDENWKTKGNFSRYDADPVHINGVFNRTTYEQNLKDVQFLFKNKGNTMDLIGLVLHRAPWTNRSRKNESSPVGFKVSQ